MQRSQREPIIRDEGSVIPGEKGLWGIAEEAFFSEARSRHQRPAGGFLWRRL